MAAVDGQKMEGGALYRNGRRDASDSFVKREMASHQVPMQNEWKIAAQVTMF